MLTTLDIIQLLVALGVIGWASHVFWRKWKRSRDACEGDCVSCPSKLAGLCESANAVASHGTSSPAPAEEELTQLPSKQRKKAQEDHV